MPGVHHPLKTESLSLALLFKLMSAFLNVFSFTPYMKAIVFSEQLVKTGLGDSETWTGKGSQVVQRVPPTKS